MYVKSTMKFTIFIFCYLEFLSINYSIKALMPESNLLMVKVLFRNGKQLPPTEPEFKTFIQTSKTKNPFQIQPYKMDDLTKEGQMDMYDLGVKIRRWYGNSLFKNKEPGNNEIKVESTSYGACTKSGDFFSKGLFKQKYEKTTKNSQTKKSPSANSLTFFYTNDSCKPYQEMLEDVSKAFYSFRQFYTTRDTIGKHLKLNPPDDPYLRLSNHLHPITPQYMWKIHEYYQAKRFGNETIPDWLTEDMMLDLEDCNKLFMESLFKYHYAKQVSGGVYTKMVMDDFDKMIQNDKNQTFILQALCTEELLMNAVMSVLTSAKSNVCGTKFNIKIPKHGAALIMELHEQNKQHFVKVLHWNIGADAPKKINYDFCAGECTLEKFKEMLKQEATTDEELNECGIPV